VWTRTRIGVRVRESNSKTRQRWAGRTARAGGERALACFGDWVGRTVAGIPPVAEAGIRD
jgi:hypothetical protein